jgi:lipopolysaccharide export system permease protein
MGNIIFILILLMFQALRLTEFVLGHGVSMSVIMEIVLYLSTSFLPIILPMSLLFSVLMTYGRLSDESEIIAMKSVGLSMSTLILPALVLSFLVSWASAQTSFNVAPWGNRQFEVLVHNLGSQKAAGVIRPGTFSEGFFSGLVIYAGKADAKTGLLEEIFIYDERSRSTPLTIIAERGQILRQTDSAAQRASLRLINGNVHRIHEGRHTKIKFTTYDILLSSPVSTSIRQQSPQSMTLEELAQVLRDPTLDSAKKIRLEIEYHRRWALCFACFIFGGLGVGLGTRGNRRSGKSSGFVMSLMIIVGYWILHATFEGLAKSQTFTPALAMWSPNIVFGTLTTMLLKKGWNF